MTQTAVTAFCKETEADPSEGQIPTHRQSSHTGSPGDAEDSWEGVALGWLVGTMAVSFLIHHPI